MLYGIDVSHHNGCICYELLCDNRIAVNERGVQFVIAKATEGVSYTDPMFERNMLQCYEHCLLTGAYHYVRGDSDPLKQAEHFISVVQDYAFTDTLLALDVEDKTLTNLNVNRVRDIVEIMVAEIYDRLHTYPVIYVSEKFMHPQMFSPIGELCGGWIAKWGDKRPSRTDLNTTIWQYSSKGRRAGVSSNVDLDIAYLTPQNWCKIADPSGVRR